MTFDDLMREVRELRAQAATTIILQYGTIVALLIIVIVLAVK